MNNFENIQFPQIPKTPFHRIKEICSFIKGEEYPLSDVVATNKKLEILTPVILIEECVGYKGLWAKVLIQDSQNKFTIFGFVLQNKVEKVEDAKPSVKCNLEISLLPDNLALEKDWRKEGTNRLFKDDKRGLFCVLYDTGVEKLDKPLQEFMSNSLYNGLSLILKERAKKHDLNYARELQDKYYLFASAEAIDFSLRNCSTLRVLVTIPKRYIESTDIEISNEETVPEPAGSSNGSDNTSSNGSDTASNTNNDNKIRYIDIKFNNFEEYDDFFEEIADALDDANTIFKSREWIIDPGVNVSLETDKSNILALKELIDLLIFSNIPAKYLDEVLGGIERLNDTYQGLSVLGEKAVAAAKNKDKNPIIIPNWEGKLSIKIDVDNLKIAYMRFDTKKNNQIPLNIGVLEFLQDELVQSKTSVNYLFQRAKSKARYSYFSSLKEAPTEFSNNLIKERYGDVMLELIDSKNINSDSDIEDEFIDTIALVSGGFSAFGVATANLFTLNLDAELSGFEKDLSDFLTKFHYPKISSITPKPLNVTNCVKNNYQITKNLINNKIPSVRDRYKQLRKLDIEKQAEKEGNEIEKYIAGGRNSVRNRNLRLLLGVDTPPPGTKAFKALNQYYLPALKELNISAIFAEILKCSAATIDPAELARLSQKYTKAKALLDQFIASTLCNPFLTSALNKLNSFQLPTIPTYNPNKNLADALTNFVVELLQKIIILSIRKYLTGSLENCLRDKNKSNDSGNASAGNNLDNLTDALENASSDAAVNDTIDDLFGINNLSPDELAAAREAAKLLLERRLKRSLKIC